MLSSVLVRQVDSELLPLMGDPPHGGQQDGLYGAQLEAIALLDRLLDPEQTRQSLELPDRGSLSHGMAPYSYAGSQPGDTSAGAAYSSAAQRRVSLDSAMLPRGPQRNQYLNGHKPFGMEGSTQAEATLYALHCKALLASQRPSTALSARSSMDLASGAVTPDMIFGGHMDGGGYGRGSLELAQQNSRGSMDMSAPPLRGSFDINRVAGNGYRGMQSTAGPRRGGPPQRHSIDIGSVQRQVTSFGLVVSLVH